MARDEQRTLASVQFDVKRKATRRHRFLQTMKEVMPWQELMKHVFGWRKVQFPGF